MERTLSRQESKELTRKRLIDGAIEILRTEGVAAATTGRIARAAGIKQSSFYGHFADRDACLQAAAAKIGNRVLDGVRRQRLAMDLGDLRGSIRRSLDATVNAFLIEPALTRMFLRFRADDESPMGKTFRELIASAHRDLQKDMRLHGVARTPAEAEVFAQLLVSATLGLIEGLLDGSVSDREVAITALTDVTCAAMAAGSKRKD